MADIFLSYAAEDRDRVRPVVDALEREGWSVWWDREIHAGPRFDQVIEDAIDKALCVVVLWSEASVGSDWVRTEANEGLERSILVPVLLDDVRPPLAFRRTQSANLTGWPQSEGEFQTLLAGITDLITPVAPMAIPADRQQSSVAVLPFVNMSSDTEQEYFADGLTEDLIDRLVRYTDLKVIARTSSFHFKGQNTDVREIGRILGVTHVVEGSIQKSGKRIRVTAQLALVEDGSHAWSERFDRDIGDFFDLQDEITDKMATQLKARLMPGDRCCHEPPQEAYEQLQRGRECMGNVLAEGAHQAGIHCQRAIDIDPDYPDAHACAAHAALTERSLNQSMDSALVERAAISVERALALDPTQPVALASKARILIHEYRLQEALDVLRSARSMPGSSSGAVLFQTCVALMYARAEDAMGRVARQYSDLDPLSVAAQFWLLAHFNFTGNLEGFELIGDRITAIVPDHPQVISGRPVVLARNGRTKEAVAIVLAWDDPADSSIFLNCAALVFALAGRTSDVERLVRHMLEDADPIERAMGSAYGNDLDGLIHNTRIAIENHHPQLWWLTSGVFDVYNDTNDIDGRPVGEIYSDPRFQELLATVGLDRKTAEGLII